MKRKKWFWGLVFILSGVLLIISKLGILDVGISAGWIVLGVLFAAAGISSILHKNIPGVLFAAAFLYIIYSKIFGITVLTPWTVLAAALLLSIGISIIYRPPHVHRSHHYDGSWDAELPGEEIGKEESDIYLETHAAASIKYITSENFRRAFITCRAGGMKVYFNHAKLPDEQAEVVLDVSASGVQLFVPQAWDVVNEAEVFAGGIQEKGRHNPDGEKTLFLRGKVQLSGLDIIYI